MISSPIGNICLAFEHGKLAGLELDHAVIQSEAKDLLKVAGDPSPAFKQAVEDLAHYFKNPKHRFTTPLHLEGTAFQQMVWRALQDIPSGKTETYGTLAKKLKTSARAIGQACRTNPIPIIIPCHRIIAANHLGGYSGKREGNMMDIKKWLLQHEQLAHIVA